MVRDARWSVFNDHSTMNVRMLDSAHSFDAVMQGRLRDERLAPVGKDASRRLDTQGVREDTEVKANGYGVNIGPFSDPRCEHAGTTSHGRAKARFGDLENEGEAGAI